MRAQKVINESDTKITNVNGKICESLCIYFCHSKWGAKRNLGHCEKKSLRSVLIIYGEFLSICIIEMYWNFNRNDLFQYGFSRDCNELYIILYFILQQILSSIDWKKICNQVASNSSLRYQQKLFFSQC